MQVGDESWMTLEASGWRNRALKAEAALARNAPLALSRESVIEATLRAAGGLHNPDDAETIADAILLALAGRGEG